MFCIQTLRVILVFVARCSFAASAGHSDEGNGIAGPAQQIPSFHEYVQAYSRGYGEKASEFDWRKAIYETRVAAAMTQNSNEDRLWTAHPNDHWDRSEDELRALSGWVRMDIGGGLGNMPSSLVQDRAESKPSNDVIYKVDDLPEAHDWLDLAAMKPNRIRSQTCGNCWAAATTAMLESHMELHMGFDARVPEVEITECSANPFECGGSGGCGGSTPELALQHTMVNGLKGLQILSGGTLGPTSTLQQSSALNGSAAKFDKKLACPSNMKDIVNKMEAAPHEAISGLRATPDESPARHFGMIGWERLPENRHEPILRALYERGPAAVAVATDWSGGGHGLSQYSSGIFDGCRKDASISHSVLAIGYGSAKNLKTDATAKYWLLQNSWGKSFGENGHFRLLRTDSSEDQCGTDREPLIGVGCKGGASEAKVCGMCGVIYDTVLPHFEAKTDRSQKLATMRKSAGSEQDDIVSATSEASGLNEIMAGTRDRDVEGSLVQRHLRANRNARGETEHNGALRVQ